jgi:DNA-binding winged helix-turn-helix (wHTH) protein
LPEKTSPDVIRVGPWRAVRATGELTRDGATERLEPKVMDLLLLLAGEPGRAFSKDEIMEALWPNVIVGDTLARAVAPAQATEHRLHRDPAQTRRLIASRRG